MANLAALVFQSRSSLADFARPRTPFQPQAETAVEPTGQTVEPSASYERIQAYNNVALYAFVTTVSKAA